MRAKRLTDAQLKYIFNTVILPRIEYKSQLTLPSEKHCVRIMASFVAFLRSKLHFSRKTPSSLFLSHYFYNVTPLHQRLIQNLSSALLQMANEPTLLGLTFKIRVRQLQTREWLHINPLVRWPYNTQRPKDDWLPALLSTLNNLNINLSVPISSNNLVSGGTTPISDLIRPIYRKHVLDLRKCSVLYAEQLVNCVGNYMFSYKDLIHITHQQTRFVRTPKWYTIMEQYLQPSPDRFITSTFPHNLMYGYTLKQQYLTPGYRSYAVGWIFNLNSFIIGRITHADQHNLYLRHYNFEKANDHSTKLIPCFRCSMHNQNAPPTNKSYCRVSIPRVYCAAFHNIYYDSSNSTALSIGALNELALTCAVASSQPHVLNIPPLVPPPVYSSCIDRFIPSPHKEELLTLSSNFISATELEFYTDGSLKDVGLPSIKMGLAWLQSHQNSPMVSFSAALTSSFPSSSIPEFAALFTAILTAPPNCRVRVYTDSAIIISQFNKFSFLKKQSPTYRPFLKINNFVLWSCLFEVISVHNLDVHLSKVKAHSNNLLNNKVDTMAKDALTLPVLQFNITAAPQSFCNYNNQPILLPIRQLVKDIFRHKHLQHILSLHVLNKYRPFFKINWFATSFCLSDNVASNHTSYVASATRMKKFQRMLEMLPTVEILKIRHPSLFSASALCPQCEAADEDFLHIWTCPMVDYQMKLLIQRVKDYLKDITNAQSTDIDNLYWWDLSTSFSFVVLIKGIVPTALFDLIHINLPHMPTALAACSSLMNFIFEESQSFWTERCTRQSAIEKAANINLKDKKANFTSSGFDLPLGIPTNNNNADPINTMVQLGSHWTNFWCSSGQALSCFIFVFILGSDSFSLG